MSDTQIESLKRLMEDTSHRGVITAHSPPLLALVPVRPVYGIWNKIFDGWLGVTASNLIHSSDYPGLLHAVIQANDYSYDEYEVREIGPNGLPLLQD